MVRRLSHQMSAVAPFLMPISASSLPRAILCLAMFERASSSACVLDIVTVSYLFAFQGTGPPYIMIIDPWDNFLVSGQSPNAASDAVNKEL